MTAQTAEYGIDYLNHAQPKDVMRWIYENFDSILMRDAFMLNAHLPSNKLTIPCHQFAASVIGRYVYHLSSTIFSGWKNIVYEHNYLKILTYNGKSKWEYLPINPFHGMTMPDGSPRTSCTREEFEAWRKELEA